MKTPPRQLVLIRHAKAAHPRGVADEQRTLSDKGLRNAQAAGHWFAHGGPAVDLVLCSSAQRALQTWEIISSSLKNQPTVMVLPELYRAPAATILAAINDIQTAVTTLAVVAHQPALGELAVQLAGEGSDADGLGRVQRKFPTNAVAWFQVVCPWPQLDTGGAKLSSFTVPRA